MLKAIYYFTNSKKMAKKKIVTNQKRIIASINFISLGFKDYIAARTVLNAGLILQGAILASDLRPLNGITSCATIMVPEGGIQWQGKDSKLSRLWSC